MAAALRRGRTGLTAGKPEAYRTWQREVTAAAVALAAEADDPRDRSRTCSGG